VVRVQVAAGETPSKDPMNEVIREGLGLHADVGADRGTRGAGRREWLGLGVLAVPCVLYSMQFMVLTLSLPALSVALHPTAAQLLWIVDIYGFIASGTLTTMGMVGDRIGRRRLLLLGGSAFGLASVLAAFSASAVVLITMRALLGLAAGTFAPATLSLIRTMFHEPRERALAIGLWTSSYSLGLAIGPVVGGVLLEHFWWGSVFLVGVPPMIVVLLLGPVLLPEYRSPCPSRIDVPSLLLSLGGVLLTIYGLEDAAEHGLTAVVGAAIIVGPVFCWLFVLRQRKLPTPMVDVTLFGTRALSAALVAYTVATFVVCGSLIFVTQYLQLVLGMDSFTAGLWLVPLSGALILGSLATPFMARRVKPALLMLMGIAMAATGFAFLSRTTVATDALFVTMACCLYALGLAPVFTLSATLVVGRAPVHQAGAAAAISETSAEFGGALGIAVLGGVATAVYRLGMIRSLGPAYFSGSGAASTLAAALEQANREGGRVGVVLREVSCAAFVQGLRAAAVACVLILGVTATILIASELKPERVA